MRTSNPVELFREAREGARASLARLLTYAESDGPRQRETAALAYQGSAPYVVGITGPPGAGKSTLTDALVTTVLERGSLCGVPVPQIAVLAVDPSSPFTGGAILGDRVRMQTHSTDPRVYIRSMATRGHLGGLSLAVPDAVRVLGAVGFSLVIVETVGVGQMEVEIAGAADATLVVSIPGAGDAMQANKAGLLEVADLFVLNKADRPDAGAVRRDLEQMLDLGEHDGWRPTITETVATTGQGLDALVDELDRFAVDATRSGRAARRRERRAAVELNKVLRVALARRVQALETGEAYEAALAAVLRGDLDPYAAAEGLLA